MNEHKLQAPLPNVIGLSPLQLPRCWPSPDCHEHSIPSFKVKPFRIPAWQVLFHGSKLINDFTGKFGLAKALCQPLDRRGVRDWGLKGWKGLLDPQSHT